MNSAHQWWSKWTFTVTPGVASSGRSARTVAANCARFGRKAFGSASEMRVMQSGAAWVVAVRTEGHPVTDAAYVAWMAAQWRRFFVGGFGRGTDVRVDAVLEAGSRQDGTPADQLIMLPSIPTGSPI